MPAHRQFNHRFTEVTEVWRQNRCLKRSSINVYRLWILRFATYCCEKQLDEREQLSLVGVHKFSKWYARSRHIDFNTVFESARSALYAWATALQTLNESLPLWAPAKKALPSPSPLICEFSEHLRLERGNPEITIHKKIQHVIRFKKFVNERGHKLHRKPPANDRISPTRLMCRVLKSSAAGRDAHHLMRPGDSARTAH